MSKDGAMDPASPPDSVHVWLASPASESARAEAVDLLSTKTPIAAAAAFAHTHSHHSSTYRAAVLGAAALDIAARGKGYPPGLLWTRTGQEQSTGPLPAARRAHLLRAAGIRSVVDLTAGLGMDSRAMLDEGISVTSVEADPATASFLEHNLAAVEKSAAVDTALLDVPPWQVMLGNCTDPQLVEELNRRHPDAWFIDPARRGTAHDGHRTRPERDPELWSPPWSFVEGLLPAKVAAKAAPGFSPGPQWHAEWVSVDRTVVECALYSWPVLGGARQAAVWLDGWQTIVALPADDESPSDTGDADIEDLLLEVDAAVVTSGALFALANEIPGSHRVDPLSSWLTAPQIDQTQRNRALIRAFRVIDEVPSSPKRLREALRARGISSIALKTGDVRIDAARLRRELRVGDDDSHAVVFTKTETGSRAFIVERVRF